MTKHIAINISLCISIIAAIISCDDPAEDISNNSSLKLSYSQDTVKFDTILSSVRSITQWFKIYNRNKNALEIDDISLSLGNNSDYNIFVNGQEGKSFQNKTVYGKDSMLILVTVFVNPMDEDLAYLVKDQVNVSYNGNQDNVKLVTWGQDAIFLNNETITCNTTWKKGKPYVLDDTVVIAKDCSLTIEAGTRVYIDNNSALEVNGTLIIEGTAKDKVEIRNTRFDEAFKEAPGQWNAIFFTESSIGNTIDHAEIRNGSVGLNLETTADPNFELSISNTSIGHMSIAGIRSFGADIEMLNVEVFRCQSELLGIFEGGMVRIDHCTFSNEPSNFSRSQPSVIFSDEGDDARNLNVSITNSIVWGDSREELEIELTRGGSVKSVMNNIIKSAEMELEANNDLSQTQNYPKFRLPVRFNYQIDSLSPARNKAPDSKVEFDLIGIMRDEMPDLGAYERKDSIK